MRGSGKTVLVCRLSALGDVAMTIPVIYSAARENPDTRFVMLTSKRIKEIFINTPANLEVIGIKKDKYKGLGGTIRLFREVRKRADFNVFADLHSVIRTHLFGAICRLRGIKTARIDKGRNEKRALTRHAAKAVKQLKSGFDRYREVFERLGIAVGDNFEHLSPEIDPSKYSTVIPPKRDGERWIGIAPFAAHEGKVYPRTQMETVLNALASTPNFRIILFGGKKREEVVLTQWEEKYDNAVSIAGKGLDLATELAIQSQLDVMVSMDSANMHLASLVGTPVVSVWGATHPYCGFGGWRQPDDNAIGLALDCRPCSVYGNKPCRRKDLFCLYGIRPQTIIDKIFSILNANS